MKLPYEPNINEGPSFMFSLKDNLRSIIRAFNGSVDEIATKAPIDSPTLTGDPKAPTPVSTDNDTSIATTAWVRNAMANIASAAGFAISIGATGYIKFPSWLGGLIIQYGTSVVTTDVGGNATINFPLTFPSSIRAVIVSNGDSAPGNLMVSSYTTAFPTTSVHAINVKTANTGAVYASAAFRCNWVAFGN